MIIEREIPGYGQVKIATTDGFGNEECVINEIIRDNVYDIQRSDFEKGKTYVDIGGNIGTTIIYAYAMGARNIIAVEPEEHSLKLLKQNLKLNNIDGVKIIEKAISDKVGKTKLSGGTYCNFTSDTKMFSESEREKIFKNGVEVDTITLDSILDPLEQVDLLKIDCEGGEYLAIKNTKTENLRKVKYIVMEYHKASDVEFGLMVAKLSEVFNVHFFGSHLMGGQLYGRN